MESHLRSTSSKKHSLNSKSALCSIRIGLDSGDAKTFKAASKSLKQEFSHPEVRSDLEVQRIEWRFNLERAPWWGSVFRKNGEE